MATDETPNLRHLHAAAPGRKTQVWQEAVVLDLGGDGDSDDYAVYLFPKGTDWELMAKYLSEVEFAGQDISTIDVERLLVGTYPMDAGSIVTIQDLATINPYDGVDLANMQERRPK